MTGSSTQFVSCRCSCTEAVDNITAYILRGEGRHTTFNRLAYLGDMYGPRQAGSQTLKGVIGTPLQDTEQHAAITSQLAAAGSGVRPNTVLF